MSLVDHWLQHSELIQTIVEIGFKLRSFVTSIGNNLKSKQSENVEALKVTN